MADEDKKTSDVVMNVNADGLLIQSAQAIQQANETIRTNEEHLQRVREKRRRMNRDDLQN